MASAGARAYKGGLGAEPPAGSRAWCWNRERDSKISEILPVNGSQ